tara:strand:- start:10825 stop:11979 length:1155 start_codon:yes stop_codon:yes gene_type:complete
VTDSVSYVEAIADAYNWKQVPNRVAEYVEAGLPAATLLKKASARFPEGAGHALLAPLRSELLIVKDDPNMNYSRWEKLATISEFRDVSISDTLPADPEGWVYIKTGNAANKPWKISDIGGIPKKLYDIPGKLIGGHNPVTGAITGGALGGLTGYAAGKGLEWLIRKPLNWLMPEHFDEDKDSAIPAIGGVLGGAVGAGIPLWIGAGRSDAHGTNFLDKFSSADLQEPEVQEVMEKMALLGGAGSMFRPTINAPGFVNQLQSSMDLHSPKDAFGNPVISHAIQPANAFGTKDPFGPVRGPMYTPPAAAGAMAGLVSGAAAARRSNWVSPMDIAKVAWGAGTGALSGIIAGKIAGGLAGLNPAGQKKLKQMGMWGGLLNAASRAIF